MSANFDAMSDAELLALRQRLDALVLPGHTQTVTALTGDQLHMEKNKPELPLGLQEWLRKQPPYRFQPFPTCVYRRRADNGELESAVAENASQLDRYLADYWVTSPADVKAARQRQIEETGLIAAHRAYEDRNMGELAAKERDAAELNTEEHLTHVPETPIRRKPGPKPKEQTSAA